MADTEHMEGVYQATRKSGEIYYRSSLTYRRRHISLGSYKDALLAHLAYRTASRLIAPNSGLTLEDYRSTSVLSFEKWVVLLNFRDNGIYLGTPIYIRPRFFYYYMSPGHVLKFDTDDLFYYASHKIMRRGSHYFVADYGMQVNIASRYGIGHRRIDFRIDGRGDTLHVIAEKILAESVFLQDVGGLVVGDGGLGDGIIDSHLVIAVYMNADTVADNTVFCHRADTVIGVKDAQVFPAEVGWVAV